MFLKLISPSKVRPNSLSYLLSVVFHFPTVAVAIVQGWPTRGSSPGFLRLLKAGINYYFQNKLKQLSVLNFHVAIMTRNYLEILNFAITSYT